MSRDFVGALLQLNAEKGVSREQLIRTVEEAIQSAYRRVAGDEDIYVRVDAESGKIRVFRARIVVEEIEDPATEMTLADARAIRPDAAVGELVETEQLDQEAFGRIHAQTAKQVVLQRLHEAERNVVFDQYASREGELITGTVSRIEPRALILDVGKAEAVLATNEQSPLEHYRIGQNVKAFVLEVRRTARGPQINVSRTHKGFLRRLFELEVPEIHAGTVEIKAIAREAGSRSKVAVASRQPGLDPVGATVGQRGARVQAVVAELGGEKVDVIEWSEDASTFVAKALSPAQVIEVRIDEEHRIANVVVPERMLSLAIGREGQNARLAAKLTGWRIDIRSDVSVAEAARAEAEGRAAAVEPVIVAAAEAASPESGDDSSTSTERLSEQPAAVQANVEEPVAEPAAVATPGTTGPVGAKTPRRKSSTATTAATPASDDAPVSAEHLSEAPAVAAGLKPRRGKSPSAKSAAKPASGGAVPAPPEAVSEPPAEVAAPGTAEPAAKVPRRKSATAKRAAKPGDAT